MAEERLAARRHREIQVTMDSTDFTSIETINMANPLRAIANRLKCEALVIDRELRIVQCFVPSLNRRSLNRPGIIGKHCFEVSHGKDIPYGSTDFECPVQRVFETKRIAVPTHYPRAKFGQRYE